VGRVGPRPATSHPANGHKVAGDNKIGFSMGGGLDHIGSSTCLALSPPPKPRGEGDSSLKTMQAFLCACVAGEGAGADAFAADDSLCATSSGSGNEWQVAAAAASMVCVEPALCELEHRSGAPHHMHMCVFVAPALALESGAGSR
jgi:hypothetical protein